MGEECASVYTSAGFTNKSTYNSTISMKSSQILSAGENGNFPWNNII